MNDINYFIGVAKLLENPIPSSFNNNLIIKFRVQLPQTRKPNKIVDLIFWGKLASDVASYYKINDYIIIEGHLGLPYRLNSKRIEITVLKIYPFILNSN